MNSKHFKTIFSTVLQFICDNNSGFEISRQSNKVYYVQCACAWHVEHIKHYERVFRFHVIGMRFMVETNYTFVSKTYGKIII